MLPPHVGAALAVAVAQREFRNSLNNSDGDGGPPVELELGCSPGSSLVLLRLCLGIIKHTACCDGAGGVGSHKGPRGYALRRRRRGSGGGPRCAEGIYETPTCLPLPTISL